jgi:arylsulfatase A-like enzyme
VNFLLIQSDQQRRDSLGAYGNRAARTATIDRLAAEGVAFDYAFTPTPLCAPARASLITGKRPMRHGIVCNVESGLAAGRDFIGRHATLAELLAARGYRSTLCGKWHVGSTLPPADCGFEGVFYPGYGYPAEHPHYLAFLKRRGLGFELSDEVHARWPGGRRGPLLSAVQAGGAAASVPHYLVDQAIEAIRRSAAAGEPFLVRVDFWGPHAPYIVPEPFAGMFDPAAVEPWPNFADDLSGKPSIQAAMKRYWGVQEFTWAEWSRLVAMCYGYVSMIDAEVARLLAALREAGVEGDTAVFYTTDHGGMVGGHGLCDKGPYLYDELARIPLVARVPGLPGGRRSDALAYNMDLMPTILDLAGCEIPADLDAVSLAPILRGDLPAVRDDDLVEMEFHGHQCPYDQRMLRTRTAKYIFNAPEFDELYDLQSDPAELHNLAADPAHAGLLAEMRDRLAARMSAAGDPLLRYFTCQRLGEKSARQ